MMWIDRPDAQSLDLSPCLVFRSCLSVYDLNCACRDTFLGSPTSGSEVSDTMSEGTRTPLTPYSSYSANLKPLKSRRPLDAMMDTMLLGLPGEALLEQWQRAQQYVATHQKDFSQERLEVLQVKEDGRLDSYSKNGHPPTPSIFFDGLMLAKKGLGSPFCI